MECRPGDDPGKRGQGNYIMYASATSGDKMNNNQFSYCSKDNMTRVIGAKGDCFVGMYANNKLWHYFFNLFFMTHFNFTLQFAWLI